MAMRCAARHDAIMVGVGTVLADNPDLTCRLPGLEPLPLVRVVVDSRLRLPLTSRLVATAAAGADLGRGRATAPTRRRAALAGDRGGGADRGAGGSPAGLDLATALQALAERGITRVLVEGGGAARRRPAARRTWWTASPGSAPPR